MDNELATSLRRLFQHPDASACESPMDHIWAFGRIQDALLYSSLFVPSFVEVEGSVLFERDQADWAEKFSKAKRNSDWPLWKLEASFNYVEVSHLFNRPQSRGATEADDLMLTRCIAEAWKGRLSLLYVGRRFEFAIYTPDRASEFYSGDLYAFNFHEFRNES
jgi:hypothetical protein